MGYLPALAAGLVVVAAAFLLRYFFTLVDWEHTGVRTNKPQSPPQLRWLRRQPVRRRAVWGARRLVHH
jgi:hypothetical protein